MRTILLYLLLVGIPVLGLSGLMRLGRRLNPPISVAGTWSMQTNSRAVGASPCVDPFARTVHLVLTITQSGTHLLLRLNDEEGSIMTGEIYGPNLSAKTLVRPDSPLVDVSSRNPTAILFNAAVDRRTQPDRLVGQLNFSDLPPCGNLAFTATRDRKGGRTEGQ
jgi:hypothetical protein